MLGFSVGPVVKNPPANAGDTGSIPGPGRSHIPGSKARAPQLLSLHSRAHEPQLLSPCAATREATATCTATKSSPRSPQLEKAHVQQQRPNADKNKINKSVCVVGSKSR